MRVRAIAINTFKEAIRDKVLYSLVVFAIIIIASSHIITPLTLGEMPKVIQDLGLAAIALFGLLVVIFVGTRLVYDEIDKRTIYTIITKPVSRGEMLVGKYLGEALVVLFIFGIMVFFYLLNVFVTVGHIHYKLFIALVFILLELLVMIAVVVFFSTFTTPVSSGIFSFFIYFIGHTSRDILVFAKLTKSEIIEVFARIIYFIIPNLSNFNLKAMAVHNVQFDRSFLYFSASYGVIYIIILLLISILIFSRREF